MKRILLAFFLLLPIFGFSQHSAENGSSSSDKKLIAQTTTVSKCRQISTSTKANSNSDAKSLKTLIPIFSLLLGVFIAQVIDVLKGRKRVKVVGRRWIAEIRSLETPLKTQRKNLVEILEFEKKMEYSYIPLQIISTLKCEIFLTLDKSDLLKFIERKERFVHRLFTNIDRRRLFFGRINFRRLCILRLYLSKRSERNFKNAVKKSNMVHGFVSVTINLYETIIDEHKKYMEQSSDRQSKVNKSFQDLNLAFTQYGVSLIRKSGNNKLPLDHPFAKAHALFAEKINGNRESGKFDMFELEQSFFVPLSAAILELMHSDQEAEEMYTQITNCLNYIMGLKREKQYWIINIEKLLERYTEQIADLKKVVEKIEGNNFQ